MSHAPGPRRARRRPAIRISRAEAYVAAITSTSGELPAKAAPQRGRPSFNRMRLRSAEPVVAAVLPVSAAVLVEHRHRNHVLGILEADLSRHAHLNRETVLARQDLAVELERH